ncbi:MAG: PHP domain-containing protein [Lachnospiraceae bacterium]|nr:PHP domain-containing protein [Lachnospiraceae bacterium]
MISLTYDFHLHSCLSPCGDEDMTPGNIAGMAVVKGLEMVALTDHNTCKNCPAFLKIAGDYGLLAIPGMELTTQEEVHVLCLFATLDNAMAFDAYVEERMIPFPNNEEIFGRQIIRDEEDEICGSLPNLLINATSISFDEVYDAVTQFHGIMVPAHLDKSTTSLISNLGFVPDSSRFTCFELRHLSNLHQYRKDHPYLRDCNVISSSDAHYLEDMMDPGYSLMIEEKTPEAVLAAINEVHR